MVFCFCTYKRNRSILVKMKALQSFAKFKLSHKMHLDNEEQISLPSLPHMCHIWSPCKARQLKNDPTQVFESAHTDWWAPPQCDKGDSLQFCNPQFLHPHYGTLNSIPWPNPSDSLVLDVLIHSHLLVCLCSISHQHLQSIRHQFRILMNWSHFLVINHYLLMLSLHKVILTLSKLFFIHQVLILVHDI